MQIHETMDEASARAALARANRIVVKIGTATISRPESSPARLTRLYRSDGKAFLADLPDGAVAKDSGYPSKGIIDTAYIYNVAEQFAELVQAGRQLILVTSGAIGMGARELGLSRRVTEVRMRQACAAIGQPILMELSLIHI